MKIKAFRLICILLAALLCFGQLTGCADSGVKSGDRAAVLNRAGRFDIRSEEQFDMFLDELFADAVTEDSITLNYFLADPSRFGIVQPAPTYGEVTSHEYIQETIEENREIFSRLMDFRYEDLREDQQIIYDILVRNLEIFALLDEKEDYSYYLGAIYPVSGIQVQLPVLLAEYNFRSDEDIESYLGLLGDTKRYFSELIEFERERSIRGFFTSDANVDKIIGNCESFLENREDNLLILIFNDKMDQYEGLSPEQREQFKQRNSELVLNNVLAAYDELLEGMRKLRGLGANQGGLADLPEGMEFAQIYLRYKTGSDRTPEEVDGLLEKEMDRALATMRSIVNSDPDMMEGYMNDTLGHIPDEAPETYIKMLETSILNDFPAIEPVRYVVHEVHESLREYLSPAFYLLPAIDSFEDNVIYINPASITDNLSLYTTLAHEGYPGHLYQSIYYLQQSPHPLRSMIGNLGYTEGWATYVEMRSYFYADLSMNEAALMQSSQLYNLLLISRVDLGVNALGWGMDRTTAYLNGLGIRDEADIEEIFQMVTCDPLSYLPYSLGYIEMESLRGEAEEALGENLDLIEFHRFLLDLGSTPFTLIRALMPDWLETQSESTRGSLAA